MAKKKKPEFPDSILITREDDGDGSPFLLEHETLESIEHGTEVAVYRLVGIQRANVARSLEEL